MIDRTIQAIEDGEVVRIVAIWTNDKGQIVFDANCGDLDAMALAEWCSLFTRERLMSGIHGSIFTPKRSK